MEKFYWKVFFAKWKKNYYSQIYSKWINISPEFSKIFFLLWRRITFHSGIFLKSISSNRFEESSFEKFFGTQSNGPNECTMMNRISGKEIGSLSGATLDRRRRGTNQRSYPDSFPLLLLFFCPANYAYRVI